VIYFIRSWNTLRQKFGFLVSGSVPSENYGELFSLFMDRALLSGCFWKELIQVRFGVSEPALTFTVFSKESYQMAPDVE